MCYDSLLYEGEFLNNKTNGKEKLYSFNAGGTIGMVSFYGTPAMYPYTLNKSVITIRQGSQTVQFLLVKDGILYNGLDKWPKVGM